MKKIIMTLTVLITAVAGVQAQFNVESAIIDLRNGDLESAKNYIDEAYNDEGGKENPKGLYYRGKIYLAIAADATLKEKYPNAGVVALESYIACIKADMASKRRRWKEADEEMLQAVPAAYNYALDHYQKGSKAIEAGDKEAGKKMITEAVNAWKVLLGAYEYDSNRQMETSMNLPKINVLQLMADAAIQTGDNAVAFKLLEDVMNSDKPVPYAFTRSALLYLETGDTTKALEIVEKGKQLFPEEKDLTTIQLMVYQAQGREDALTDKITEALASDPENPTLLANRANIYDNRARAAVEELKKEVEKSYKLSGEIRKERDAKKKAELKKTQEATDARVQELLAKSQRLDSLAIEDYKKSFEVNPDQFDVVFNLGAIYFNGALPLVEIANNLPADGNYEKNYAALKARWVVKYEKALEWFLKAEEMRPDDESVLVSIQQCYAQLGNQEKSMEYKKKREGQ